MKLLRRKLPRSPRLRADLMLQLGRMEQAGIPRAKAFALLADNAPSRYANLFKRASLELSKGRAVAETGLRLGLWLPWEADLIRVGEAAGRLEETFMQMHQHFDQRASNLHRLRGHLVFPIAVWLIGISVLPLPALLRGELTAAGYLAGVLLQIFSLVAIVLAIRSLMRFSQTKGLPLLLSRIIRETPFVGEIYRRQMLRNFIWGLWLQLSAGVPAQQALKRMAQAASPFVASSADKAAQSVEKGHSLVSVLRDNRLIADERGIQLLAAGEASGATDDMLKRVVDFEDQWLALRYELIGERFPWLIYGLLLASLLL